MNARKLQAFVKHLSTTLYFNLFQVSYLHAHSTHAFVCRHANTHRHWDRQAGNQSNMHLMSSKHCHKFFHLLFAQIVRQMFIEMGYK